MEQLNATFQIMDIEQDEKDIDISKANFESNIHITVIMTINFIQWVQLLSGHIMIEIKPFIIKDHYY